MLLKKSCFLTNCLQDKVDINVQTVATSSERLKWLAFWITVLYSSLFFFFFLNPNYTPYLVSWKRAWLSSSASAHDPQEIIVFLGSSIQRLSGKACFYSLRGNEVVIWIYSGQLQSQGWAGHSLVHPWISGQPQSSQVLVKKGRSTVLRLEWSFGKSWFFPCRAKEANG